MNAVIYPFQLYKIHVNTPKKTLIIIHFVKSSQKHCCYNKRTHTNGAHPT